MLSHRPERRASARSLAGRATLRRWRHHRWALPRPSPLRVIDFVRTPDNVLYNATIAACTSSSWMCGFNTHAVSRACLASDQPEQRKE